MTATSRAGGAQCHCSVRGCAILAMRLPAATVIAIVELLVPSGSSSNSAFSKAPRAPTDTVRIHLPDRNQLFWLFFSLNGRISPAVYFLAGLLVFIMQLFPIYRIHAGASGERRSARLGDGLPGRPARLGLGELRADRQSGCMISASRRPGRWSPWSSASSCSSCLPFVKGDAGPNQYGARTNAPA